MNAETEQLANCMCHYFKTNEKDYLLAISVISLCSAQTLCSGVNSFVWPSVGGFLHVMPTVTVSFRLVWWRTNVRTQVKRQSHFSTNSSLVLVQRVTVSTPLDSPTCQKRSSRQVTGRPENLRGAPSACDSLSTYLYILQ